MSREKKKPRVYEENVKTRHTAHWDWDYLPWKEIERRLKEAGLNGEERVVQDRKHRRRYIIWIAFGLLILAGLLFVLFGG